MDVLSCDMFMGSTGERTMFAIEAKSAVMITDYSALGDEEAEWLIPPGTLLEVTGVLPQGDLQIIQLKEIDGPPLIDLPSTPSGKGKGGEKKKEKKKGEKKGKKKEKKKGKKKEKDAQPNETSSLPAVPSTGSSALSGSSSSTNTPPPSSSSKVEGQPPPARCFEQSPQISFEDSIRAVMLDLKAPPGIRDLPGVPDEDDVDSLIYRCHRKLSEMEASGSAEVRQVIRLLTRDEALAILAFTCADDYPLYDWVNGWLAQDREDPLVKSSVGPYFRLLYQGLEKLPQKTFKAMKGVFVRDSILRDRFSSPPDPGAVISFSGISSFFLDGAPEILWELPGTGEEDVILYSCGSLRGVLLGDFTFYPADGKFEVIPLPPAVFKVQTTIKANEKKLVISLDHDEAAQARCSYVPPLIDLESALSASSSSTNTPPPSSSSKVEGQPPPARCFEQSPQLSFEDSIRAVMLDLKAPPGIRNLRGVPDEDDVDTMIYCCEHKLSEMEASGSAEVRQVIRLLTRDEALAILAFTCVQPYPLYDWVNGWLAQDREDPLVKSSVGPYFRLLYQGLEKLPQKTFKAMKEVLVRDSILQDRFNSPPDPGAVISFSGISSFFLDGVPEMVCQLPKTGKEDVILYSCGSLRGVLLGDFSFYPEDEKFEVIPLPPAVFKVQTSIKMGKKLVISLEHDEAAHVRCSYVPPSRK